MFYCTVSFVNIRKNKLTLRGVSNETESVTDDTVMLAVAKYSCENLTTLQMYSPGRNVVTLAGIIDRVFRD